MPFYQVRLLEVFHETDIVPVSTWKVTDEMGPGVSPSPMSGTDRP